MVDDGGDTFFHMLSPCLFWMYSAMFCRISPYMFGPSCQWADQLETKTQSYGPPKKNWVTPKNWGTAWWLCKDRGQRVGFRDPFIESLGVWAREGALRTGLHVTVAIHSQELTHMMVMMLVSLVMRCILYGVYFVTMAQSGNFSLNFWTNGIYSINCHAVTFSLSSESSYERKGSVWENTEFLIIIVRSGGQKRWYIFGHLKIQLKGSAG